MTRKVRRKTNPSMVCEVAPEQIEMLTLVGLDGEQWITRADEWEDVPPTPVWVFGDLVTHPEHGVGVVIEAQHFAKGCLCVFEGKFPSYQVPADSLTAAPREAQGMRQIGWANDYDDIRGWTLHSTPEAARLNCTNPKRIAVPVYVADPSAPPLVPCPEGSVVVLRGFLATIVEALEVAEADAQAEATTECDHCGRGGRCWEHNDEARARLRASAARFAEVAAAFKAAQS